MRRALPLVLALAFSSSAFAQQLQGDGSVQQLSPLGIYLEPGAMPQAMPGIPLVFQDTFATTGALIPDDPGTVAHVYWNGTALVDTKGNAWTQNGTVPQVSGANASPLYPNGFAQNPRQGAGPFSASNNYRLPAGNVLDFPASGPFSVCVAWVHAYVGAYQMLLASHDAQSSGFELRVDPSQNMQIGWNGRAQATAVGPTTGGPNIACGGRLADDTYFLKLNGGAIATGAMGSAYSASGLPTTIGAWNTGQYPTVGQILEVWASTTTPSDALFTQIQSAYLGHIADTGQALTVTRASTATDVINGKLWTWPANVARVDPSGLLIEVGSTNLVLQSGDLSNAAWTKAGSVTAPTVTANAATAPDGTVTAAQVAFPAVSGAGAFSAVYQSSTLTAASYAWSIWLKTASGTATIYLGGNVGGTTYVSTPCAVTTAWSRCTVTGTPTAASWDLQIGVDLRDASETAQSAQTVYAWGAQLEQQPFATSYIATTTTATTRALDAVSAPIPPVGPNFSTSVTGNVNSDMSGYRFLLAMGGANGSANSVSIYRKNANAKFTCDIYDGAAAVQEYASTASAPSGSHKYRISVSGGVPSGYLDGSLYAGTVGGGGTGLASGMTTLWLGGQNANAGLQLFGYITQATVCKTPTAGACQ